MTCKWLITTVGKSPFSRATWDPNSKWPNSMACKWVILTTLLNGMILQEWSPQLFNHLLITHDFARKNTKKNHLPQLHLALTGSSGGRVVSKSATYRQSLTWLSRTLRDGSDRKEMVSYLEDHPISKWLISMVSKSPNWGCSLYKWPFMAYKWWLLSTY